MLEVHDRRAIAPESDAHAQVWERVCAALRVCAPGARQRGLDPATLLIDELGLDSLKFVDLTVALEDALGIHEFPMQEWVDEELSAGRSLSVGALATRCLALLDAEAS